ncbi:MAG TPA: PH domain-containing protein [Candidatus Levybacteria bacterium]|nr:PH domain-containing protein [Candidatus Levybacteria bacterium]
MIFVVAMLSFVSFILVFLVSEIFSIQSYTLLKLIPNTFSQLPITLSIFIFLGINYVISRMYLSHYKYEVDSDGVRITTGFRDSKLRSYSKGNVDEVKITANLAELVLGIYDVLIIPRNGKKSKLAIYNPGRIIGLDREKAEAIYRSIYTNKVSEE